MNIPVICENCRAELTARYGPGGIVVVPCECKGEEKNVFTCKRCGLELSTYEPTPESFYWKEKEGEWYCDFCCGNSFAHFPEDEAHGLGVDEIRSLKAQARVGGWRV